MKGLHLRSPLIHLDAVSRIYPQGHVRAIQNVTLHFHPHDYTAITGPSGSGKSTLLYLAGGLDRPTSRRVLFDGRDPSGPAAWTRTLARSIGFVFQSFHLIKGLTAEQNV